MSPKKKEKKVGAKEFASDTGKLLGDALGDRFAKIALMLMLVGFVIIQLPHVLNAMSSVHHRFFGPQASWANLPDFAIAGAVGIIMMVCAVLATGLFISLILYLPFGAAKTSKDLDRATDELVVFLERVSLATQDAKANELLTEAKGMQSERKRSLRAIVIRALAKGW